MALYVAGSPYMADIEGVNQYKVWKSKSESLTVMSDSGQSHELQPAWLLCPFDYPGKNTAVGFHALLHGIFSILGWNLHLLCWQACSLSLAPPGKPTNVVIFDYLLYLPLGR